MSSYHYIEGLLEKSIEKYGSQPLTTKRLLNLIRAAKKKAEKREQELDAIENSVMSED